MAFNAKEEVVKLLETPRIVTIKELTKRTDPTCAETMILAAKMAEEKKWPIVQFDHPNPPRFKGPKNSSKTVTLVDSSKLIVPQSLIHVGKELIGVNGYTKLVPNYKELVRSVCA